jgi:hypothetical protein
MIDGADAAAELSTSLLDDIVLLGMLVSMPASPGGRGR